LAKEIKTIDFDGEIDLVLGDFSKSNLEKVCDISYPAIYKFWKEKPIFNENDIENCENLLNDYAQSLGFYNSLISYKIEEDKAIFDIKKNEQIKIASIEVDDEYKSIIELKVNDGFVSSNFTNSKKNIYKHLSNTGYAKAVLDAKAYVDIDEYKVDIKYEVVKNSIQKFGDIKIKNDAKIDMSFLEKNIEFVKGQDYNSTLIDKTYENLYNFGIYKYIRIEPDLDKSTDDIPVDINLVQGDYRETSYGIGYDTNTKARFKAQYKNDNFLGNLKSFTIGTKVSQDGFELFNNLYNPYFIKDDVSFNNDVSYEDMNYTSYSQKKIEEKLSLSKDFFGLSNTAGVLLQHSTLESDLKEYESGSYLLNSFFYEAILDRRDDILNPKNGYYLSFYIENGTKAIASEIDYIKTLTQARYLKTFDKFTSSFKTTIGTLNKDLPIFKHFFAGGDYSNRGYAYEKVGKKDYDDNPYGGLSMIDSSLEFEYAIKKDLGIVTFFDSTMLSLEVNKFNENFSMLLDNDHRFCYFSQIIKLNLNEIKNICRISIDDEVQDIDIVPLEYFIYENNWYLCCYNLKLNEIDIICSSKIIKSILQLNRDFHQYINKKDIDSKIIQYVENFHKDEEFLIKVNVATLNQIIELSLTKKISVYEEREKIFNTSEKKKYYADVGRFDIKNLNPKNNILKEDTIIKIPKKVLLIEEDFIEKTKKEIKK